ncbi:MAG TPA: AAA family ATPase [Candidatus Dormibacteraeota bacterium]|nr:AAA family ATPase [Candidatus Dormibacteraeota bacterium]
MIDSSKLARTISIANQKGGVGKTTTTVNLGAALAEQGQRVLLVDLDAQAHLTINMGVKAPDEINPTIYELLVDHKCSVNDIIQESERIGVHFLPSNIELSGAEISLFNEIGREGILREKLEPVQRRYDYIVIDCPPSLSLLTLNAFVASDEVIIPLQCEYFGMKGMQQLLNTVERVRAKLNPQLKVHGILPTIFKSRTLHSREVLGLVRDAFGDSVFPFAIKDSIRFAESPLAGASILQYAPQSDGARAYRELAKAVISSHGNPGPSEGPPGTDPTHDFKAFKGLEEAKAH